MNIYYKIWIDCIQRALSIPANKGNWKRYTMIFMSMSMALNFMVFIAILQREILDVSFYHLSLDIFPGRKLDAFMSFFILFLSPMLLINYFLIFRNNRYEILIKKYKTYNGKLFISYFLASLILPLLLLVIGKTLF